MALNRRDGPLVIIAAGGMCENGRIVHHLKHAVSDERNTILIIGFQAEHTLGRRIVERRPELHILGRTLPLRATPFELTHDLVRSMVDVHHPRG